MNYPLKDNAGNSKIKDLTLIGYQLRKRLICAARPSGSILPLLCLSGSNSEQKGISTIKILDQMRFDYLPKKEIPNEAAICAEMRRIVGRGS